MVPGLLDLLHVGGDLGEILDECQAVLEPGDVGRRVGLHIHHEMPDLVQADGLGLAKGGLDLHKALLCRRRVVRSVQASPHTLAVSGTGDSGQADVPCTEMVTFFISLTSLVAWRAAHS